MVALTRASLRRRLRVQLPRAALHPLLDGRAVPQRQAGHRAGVLGPVRPGAPAAQRHRPRQVVAPERARLPLHPRPLPRAAGAAAVSGRRGTARAQGAPGGLVQMQAPHPLPQPVRAQGLRAGGRPATEGPEAAAPRRGRQSQPGRAGERLLEPARRAAPPAGAPDPGAPGFRPLRARFDRLCYTLNTCNPGPGAETFPAAGPGDPGVSKAPQPPACRGGPQGQGRELRVTDTEPRNPALRGRLPLLVPLQRRQKRKHFTALEF